METEINKLKELLTANKEQEATELIKEIASKDLTPEEEGAVLVGIAEIYMTLENSANEDYAKALASLLESFKQVDAAESGSKDGIRIQQLRKDLGISG